MVHIPPAQPTYAVFFPGSALICSVTQQACQPKERGRCRGNVKDAWLGSTAYDSVSGTVYNVHSCILVCFAPIASPSSAISKLAFVSLPISNLFPNERKEMFAKAYEYRTVRVRGLVKCTGTCTADHCVACTTCSSLPPCREGTNPS